MKKFFFPIVGTVIILFLYTYYAENSMNKRDMKNYFQFNNSDINDKIINIEEYARGVKLHLEDKTVVFYPQTSKLNNNSIFIFTAKVGDRIIKKPFQDTLILETKENKIYKYTFFKFQK